ncbi:MAG: hypothetical protein PHC99_03810 [Methylococcales bacterium]|nr:hypothetical protein [Methylococcales bacterium]
MTVIIMTPYGINSSSQAAYATKTFANSNLTNKLDTSSNVAPVLTNTSDTAKSDSLVQSVLQSLQNLGLNASTDSGSSETNNALQTFVQNLYTALAPSGNPPPLIPPSAPMSPPQVVDVSANTDGGIVESTTPTTTSFSGGTNFKYTVDLSGADLGDNLQNVAANFKTALDNIGQYISSNVKFDLKVLTENTDTGTLAETNSSIITTTLNQQQSIDTSFVSDSIHGAELSPNTPDATLYINLAQIDEMSFSGVPTPDKFDLTSILTHEILHGLAFTGAIDSGAAPLKTGYDELTTTDTTTPLFVGRHAETTNGGNPIPLASAASGAGSAFYHVAIPNDLMSESIKKGEVKTISALDVAMLQDMGLSVTGLSPNSPTPKIQAAYNSFPPTPSDAVKNLMNSMQQDSQLQTSFDNLVSALGGADGLPDVNLQNFLTQLSANTQQLPPIENTGSLFSVSA